MRFARARVHVGGELGVAVDGEALLEAELEPVAAGDPVAGPVVEILVRHHRFDPLMRSVGGGVGRRQQIRGVEDVEALVLHRPHVEVLDGDDHEDVQVVLAPEALLVPAHGAFEGVHGVAALADVVRLGVDVQRHGAARARDEGILAHSQVAGDQGEQIARLRERIVPNDGASPIAHMLAQRVPVRQKHRIAFGVGGDRRREPRQHVWPIRVVGDLAEALGLALGAVHRAGLVQALQGGVLFGLDAGADAHAAGVRHVEHGEGLAVDGVFVAAKRPSVHLDAVEDQVRAVQHQGRTGLASGKRHLALDDGFAVADVEREPRLGQRERIALVVLEAHGLGNLRHAASTATSNASPRECSEPKAGNDGC